MRRALLPAVLALAATGSGGVIEANAGTDCDLYTVTVRVTGQGEATRGPGVAKALGDVLVKVSGNPALALEPAAIALASEAAGLVDGWSYRDLMEGIPVHDEQGSRDRPYALTVRFDPARIDAALKALDTAPWPEPRPSLTAVVTVTNGATRFVLADDGARGRDMREALAAAADQYGMQVTVPTEAAARDAPTPSPGGAATLFGALDWDDGALGWTAEWRMTTDGTKYRWTTGPVSFDEAFRAAVGGAAQILSGHGAPN